MFSFFSSFLVGFYSLLLTVLISAGALLIIGWGVVRILTLATDILPVNLCSLGSLQCKLISAAALILGIIFLSTGLYLKGRNDMDIYWQEQQKSLEQSIDQSEKLSKKEVELLKSEIQKLTLENKNIVQGNVKYVKENFIKYDSNCTIPTDVILYLNEVSQGISAGSGRIDGTGK